MKIAEIIEVIWGFPLTIIPGMSRREVLMIFFQMFLASYICCISKSKVRMCHNHENCDWGSSAMFIPSEKF
jgi:hypothetical protein